jgi:hypothetical protein
MRLTGHDTFFDVFPGWPLDGVMFTPLRGCQVVVTWWSWLQPCYPCNKPAGAGNAEAIGGNGGKVRVGARLVTVCVPRMMTFRLRLK